MKKTVLVLEDEVAVMKLMRQILERYTIIEAKTAEEGLLVFIDHNCRIDLLIADLTLPKLSGLQVALHLRSKLPNLPVIVTSGYPLSSWKVRDSADLERLGPTLVNLLEKPFRAEALFNAVHNLIGMPGSAEVARTA